MYTYPYEQHIKFSAVRYFFLIGNKLRNICVRKKLFANTIVIFSVNVHMMISKGKETEYKNIRLINIRSYRLFSFRSKVVASENEWIFAITFECNGYNKRFYKWKINSKFIRYWNHKYVLFSNKSLRHEANDFG